MRTTRIDRLRQQLGIPGAFILDPMPNGTDMTINSTASVPTAHASRYLQQLCKHWSHNLAVEFDEARGTVTFPRNARGADWPATRLWNCAQSTARSNVGWRQVPPVSSKV